MNGFAYEQTRRQFGPAAAAYSSSALFAQGEDLGWLIQAARPQPHEVALDIGTAAGHTAFALAPHVRQVIGLDVTPAMIEVASANAQARGLTNFTGVVAQAEEMPYADATFDLVTCRYTAHHFHAPDRVMQEIARVLRPGGRAVIIDNTAPDDPALDHWINVVEVLRDPSHVKEWSLREWEQLFGQAGLAFTLLRTWLLPLEFTDWVARQQTPPERVAALRRLLQEADATVREAFAIDGFNLSLLTRLMLGTKP